MKITQTLLAAAVLSTGLLTATGAHAALQSRLGGLAVYDTDLNITWLADANANGLMTWSQATTWAAGLTVGGFSGWRLPTTLQPSDPACSYQVPGAGGWSSGYNCTGSEMGHLFYNELGGVATNSILTTHNANLSLFQNLQSNIYRSGTVYAPNNLNDSTWYFYFSNGDQNAYLKTYNMYAMAVRPGDVAAVPAPAAAWLLGSGLIGLAGVARKRKAA